MTGSITILTGPAGAGKTTVARTVAAMRPHAVHLHTDDFWGDYHALQVRGVHFVETPRTESYGTVAVFEDIYRNRWDLLQLTSAEA